jgi:hypothetical protein
MTCSNLTQATISKKKKTICVFSLFKNEMKSAYYVPYSATVVFGFCQLTMIFGGKKRTDHKKNGVEQERGKGRGGKKKERRIVWYCEGASHLMINNSNAFSGLYALHQ